MGADRHLCGAQQTRGFDPMLFQYWPTANGAWNTLHRALCSPIPANTDIVPILVQCRATVFDSGPTLIQHWINGSCFLDILWNSMTSTSSSWLIQWSMGEGSYITLFSPSDVTAFHRIKWGLWERGCYITLFSPSDVSAFHRIIFVMNYQCVSFHFCNLRTMVARVNIKILGTWWNDCTIILL